MTEYLGTPRPTSRFTGVCETCKIPTARDLPAAVGDYTTTEPWLGSPRGCVKCGEPVKLQRIYGVLTGQPCHGACMGAVGPVCECGCGGINHGGMLVWRENMTASELDAHNKAVAAYQAKRERMADQVTQRREAKAAAKRAEGDAWRAAHPKLAAWLAGLDEPPGSFLARMAEYAAADGLFDRTTEICERIMAERAERAQRDAERAEREATAQPVPEGTTVVEGEIVSVKWEPAYVGPGEVAKILVVSDDGWKVYGTCPRSLMDRELRGCRVRFTAEIKPKERAFGYFSRPRKAEHAVHAGPCGDCGCPR